MLFLPALVKADSSGPGIIPFKATPKSPNGADIYRWETTKEDYIKTGKKLEYGKVITITWEEEYVPVDEEDDENEDVVKLSDLVTVEKNYKIDEKNLAAPYEVLVLQKMEIKKGPANAYESTGKTIPANVKVKIRDLQYYNKEEKEYIDEDTAWAYVEYNGTKGFVNTEDSIAFNGTYTTIICYAETNITNVEYTKILGTINPYTKFNAMVYERDRWASGYYIEFGSIKGIIYGSNLLKRKTITLKPTRDIKVYKELKEDNDSDAIISEVITTIKSETSFTANYYLVDNICATIYYEKDNTKGWIRECEWDYNEEGSDSEDDYVYIDDILNIEGYSYDTFGEVMDNPIVIVEKGANDDKNSAVTIFETPKDIDNIEEEEEDEEETTTGPESGDSSVAPEQPETETKSKKKVPELIYYCLGAAVIVSLTAIVTTLLINKKKKSAKSEAEKTTVEEKSNKKK